MQPEETPVSEKKTMCDEHTQKHVDEFVHRAGVTRRQFGKLSAAAGLAMMLPPVANAQDVTETDVDVTTPDGVADCYFVHASTGQHPAVIIWPDILGLRPAFRAMGERLAHSGYSVRIVWPPMMTRTTARQRIRCETPMPLRAYQRKSRSMKGPSMVGVRRTPKSITRLRQRGRGADYWSCSNPGSIRVSQRYFGAFRGFS